MLNQRPNTRKTMPQDKTGEPHMTVLTDFALWNLLFQGHTKKKPHRYSKAEAFFDLMKREQLMALTGGGTAYTSNNFQSLANAWSWNRMTVKKFVDALCSIGAASVTTDEYEYTVRLKNICGLPTQGDMNPQQSLRETAATSDYKPSDGDLRAQTA